MAESVKNSQVADRGSLIKNSQNKVNISINKIRKEAIIISFIVGVLSSLLASYAYEHWFK
jgi:hypothetical protein